MNLVDVKIKNRNKVYRLVYHAKQISKPEIAAQLEMSLPTVSQCVNELKKLGLAEEQGFFASTGGRKAAMIASVSDTKIAIGVNIQQDHVALAAVNLYGVPLLKREYACDFENSDVYFVRLGNQITNFFVDLNITKDRLLGVGIAVQGIVNNRGTQVNYAKILNTNEFHLEQIQRYVPFTCILQHDANAQAYDAAKRCGIQRDAVYISLNTHVGGAMILDNQMRYGEDGFPGGLVEHMILMPDGRPCYCGKKGCFEAYCSESALLKDTGVTLEEFIPRARGGEEPFAQKWTEFLKYLALTVYNLHVLLDVPVILGGHIANYMNEEDVEALKCAVMEQSNIIAKPPVVLLSTNDDGAVGSAMYYIDNFLAEFEF